MVHDGRRTADESCFLEHAHRRPVAVRRYRCSQRSRTGPKDDDIELINQDDLHVQQSLHVSLCAASSINGNCPE